MIHPAHSYDYAILPVDAETDIESALPAIRYESAEKNLLRALLEEAITTFLRHYGHSSTYSQRSFIVARDWFASDDNDDGTYFTFRHVCQSLNIDPLSIRRGLSARCRMIDAQPQKKVLVKLCSVAR